MLYYLSRVVETSRVVEVLAADILVVDLLQHLVSYYL
jgi:hypothetical protein